MGLRTRALILGVATYLVSPLGLALGLGEIKIKSHLNQPLEAEIQLLQTRELTAQEILVGLGTPDDFRRVGVDRPFFLNDLKFSVDMNHPNGPTILVKSTRLVREPFLNFIVQTQWPSGKLLREYTLLLDLPLFSEEPARAVTAAKAQAQPIAPQPQLQPAPSQPQLSSFDGDTYGPVSASDTLWTIAQQVRPSDDVTVQQTMLAMQRLNPNAFINNNINLLKKGAVLRLPSVSDITDFDPNQANREVANQNSAANLASPQAQIDGTRSQVDRGSEAEKIQGRVKLSSATDVTASQSGSGGGDAEQDAQALRTQLLSTQEELTSTQRENADLTARIQSMDEQIETMDRLLEVANSDLRKLELALAEQESIKQNLLDEQLANEQIAEEQLDKTELAQEEISIEDALDAARAKAEAAGQIETSSRLNSDEMADIDAQISNAESEAVSADTDLDVSRDPAQDINQATQIQTTQIQETQEAQAKPVETDPVDTKPVDTKPLETKPIPPAKTVATKDKSFIDIIMENLLYIGGGIVVLIGGLVLFLLARGNSSKDDDFEYEEFDENDDPIAAANDFDEHDASDSLNLAPQSQEPESQDLNLDDSKIEEELTLESLESELLNTSSSVNPLEQADNHIALGEYPEALAVLDGAGETSDVQLKRLEVFAKQDNASAFDKQYAQFELAASANQVQHAQDLRGLLSSALLGSAVAGLDYEADPDADDLDTTLQFNSVTEADIEAAGQSSDHLDSDKNVSAESDELSLDEELSLDGELTLDNELELNEELGLDEELSLDDLDASLDLDLGADLELEDDSLVALGSEPSEEGISEDIDFTALDLEAEKSINETLGIEEEKLSLNSIDDSSDEIKAVDELGVVDELVERDDDLVSDPSTDGDILELNKNIAPPQNTELSLDLEDTLESEPEIAFDVEGEASDDSELSLDLEDFGASADSNIATSSLLHDDALDIEIRESSSISEDNDELDLSGLSKPSDDASVQTDFEALDLGLDDDLTLDSGLSLDSDLNLGDDLSLADDLSLDDDLTLDSDSNASDTESLEDIELGEDKSDSEIDLSAKDAALESTLTLEAIEEDELSADDIAEGSALSLEDDIDEPHLQDAVSEMPAPAEPLATLDDELDDLDSDLDALSSDFKGDLADLDSELTDLDDDLAELDTDLADLDTHLADEVDTLTVEPEALSDVALDDISPEKTDDISPEKTKAAVDEAEAALPEPDLETKTELEEKKVTEEPEGLEAEALASSDEINLPDFDPDSDDDSEPSFLGDSDEVATKIDLLRVFVDMGDTESALNTLQEIREEGNDSQKQEAEALFAELD